MHIKIKVILSQLIPAVCIDGLHGQTKNMWNIVNVNMCMHIAPLASVEHIAELLAHTGAIDGRRPSTYS